MISISNLTFMYGADTVLNNINLNIEDGLIHGLVGLNGSGKTTFLNILYGVLRKHSGMILYNNRKLNKRDISYLQTENFFYSAITGKEYLDLFSYYNPNFDYMPLIRVLDLPLNKLIDKYSTGMKRKIALVASLIPSKDILILDEPFNGLDVEASFILSRLIVNLKKRNKTIIVTSHIMEVLTPLCDKIHYLNHGTIETSFAKTEFDDLKFLFEKNLCEKYNMIDKISL